MVKQSNVRKKICYFVIERRLFLDGYFIPPAMLSISFWKSGLTEGLISYAKFDGRLNITFFFLFE